MRHVEALESNAWEDIVAEVLESNAYSYYLLIMSSLYPSCVIPYSNYIVLHLHSYYTRNISFYIPLGLLFFSYYTLIWTAEALKQWGPGDNRFFGFGGFPQLLLRCQGDVKGSPSKPNSDSESDTVVQGNVKAKLTSRLSNFWIYTGGILAGRR